MKIEQIQSPEEYEAVLRIRTEVFIEEQEVPEELELDPLQGHNFLLWEDSSPIGTGRYLVKQGLVKYERIAILKAFRGRGVGKLLMEHMQADAKKRFPDHLNVMHAQVYATPFYEKLGWRAIGDVFLDADIEHKWMVIPPENPELLTCRDEPNLPAELKAYLRELL